MQKQLLSVFVLVAVALACVGEASALVPRTFVSKFGLDTNPCSATEPCRTFGAAIAQTQAGGEVLALDTAGYGPVTVTKAISLISPPGVYAGITTTTAGVNAINVFAGPNDVVVLRGLSLSGLGLGTNGVRFDSGKALRVEGLVISGFTNGGILLDVDATTLLSVSDTVVRDNGGIGIFTYASLGLVNGAIDRTTLYGNGYGLFVGRGGRVTVRDSAAAQNTTVGFMAEGPATAVNLENCLTTGNGYGLFSSDAFMRVAGTTVTENNQGISVLGSGGVYSRGNNTVEGNAGSHTFTALFAAK